jgi:hypothetical protein
MPDEWSATRKLAWDIPNRIGLVKSAYRKLARRGNVTGTMLVICLVTAFVFLCGLARALKGAQAVTHEAAEAIARAQEHFKHAAEE